MAEPQNHYLKWKKADMEGHMLYDYIHKKYLEKLNSVTEGWLMTARDWGRSRKLGATAY